MTRSAWLLITLGALVVGLLAGIYLQHRWPVGRWREPRGPAPTPAAIQTAAIARLPVSRRLVLVVAGQSNAANYGSVPAAGGPGVYAWHDGVLFPAQDPLPGADQSRGSPWTRLGAMLMLTGRYDAVVFASLAQGSSQVADWAPGGRLHDRLRQTLVQLQSAGLPARYVLWQQGESEGGRPDASGRDYLENLAALLAATRALSPEVEWIIARATYAGPHAGNAQIREAQRLAGTLPGAHSGPDLDALDAAYRSDGIHFNGPGLDAAAARWRESLDPLLERSAP